MKKEYLRSRNLTVCWIRLAVLALLCGPFLKAQSEDDTQLKQVILFGRHGVRTGNLPNSVLDNFSARPYPVFPDAPADAPPATLTDHGAANEKRLAAYFRQWLTLQGLLTGQDAADAANVYFRAAALPVVYGTAQAFAAGLLPEAQATVNTVTPAANDPLFSPTTAGTAQLDLQMAVAAVNGRLGGNAQALAEAYAPEFVLMRSVLFGYPASESPAPPAPSGKIDIAALPIAVSLGNANLAVDLGGLTKAVYAMDPWVMQYMDGLPASEVAWGRLDAAGISQVFRLYDLLVDLEFRTPYLAGKNASNLASHIVRTLVQSATGAPRTGALGVPASKVIVLTGSNFNLAALSGLFGMQWILPGYQPNVPAPDGVLMFELRQSLSTGEYIVRTSYTAQTMDQLRDGTPLTLAAPPASTPVFVPGCSTGNATFDCSLSGFVRAAKGVIDPGSADTMN